MKVNKLTQKQEDTIRDYEVGRELLSVSYSLWKEEKIRFYQIKQELLRIIKRIEDEIEFLNWMTPWWTMWESEYVDGKEKRLLKLEKELRDYKLMGSLE